MRNMKKLSCIKSLFIALLVLMSMASAGQKYAFEYKLSKGDTFKRQMSTDMWITQSSGSETLEIISITVMDLQYNVTDVSADLYTIEAKFENIKTEMDFGFDKMIFDSNTEEEIATIENMSPIFKAMTGIPFEMTINKQGVVQSIKGFENMRKIINNSIGSGIEEELRVQMIRQIEEQFSEEALTNMFNQTAAYMPQTQVGVGDTWETEVSIQNALDMSTITKNSLKEVKNNTAYIECFGEISVSSVVQHVEGMDAKISMEGSNSGNVSIDLATGMPVDFSMAQEIIGETEIMNMKIPQKIVIKTTIRAIK